MSFPDGADDLNRFVAAELDTAVDPIIAEAARRVTVTLGGIAALFYGSNLRTGELDGVVDFYVLTQAATGSHLRRAATTLLWPDVSYHELTIDGHIVRAKVAAMPLATFARAARGRGIDTTIWTRFVQPAALVHAIDEQTTDTVRRAVGDAAITAACFAAALGPARGTAADYWRALFARTYEAELRVEPAGRNDRIVGFAPARYDALLPLAWRAGGVAFGRAADAVLERRMDAAERSALVARWRRRARLGKPLNLARLLKATFTFDGAARYGLWKVERHTGVRIALTPWRERHPVLAAPGVLWRVVRARAS